MVYTGPLGGRWPVVKLGPRVHLPTTLRIDPHRVGTVARPGLQYGRERRIVLKEVLEEGDQCDNPGHDRSGGSLAEYGKVYDPTRRHGRQDTAGDDRTEKRLDKGSDGTSECVGHITNRTRPSPCMSRVLGKFAVLLEKFMPFE